MSDDKDLAFLSQYEVGANFFEMIEFALDRRLPNGDVMRGIYGVNVVKVREVVRIQKINPLASAHPGIAGVFELRGVPIPAINLCHVLGDPQAALTPDMQIIVTEFAKKRAGFIVSSTHRIRRVGWDKVLPPSSDHNSFMSGMVLVENNDFLFILDLERILADLEAGASGLPKPSVAAPTTGTANRDAPGILFVDDSKLILANVGRALSQRYRVLYAENGLQAYQKLEAIVSGRDRSFGSVDMVVTDVEMPQMDGLTLTKKIKESKALAHLPVILHTSLSGEVTQSAGLTVGADGYVVKNDIPQLLQLAETLMNAKAVKSA